MFFFFNDTATTEIYTLSLHDALPISTFSDKSQIWADNAQTSPFFGNVYVCWASFRSNSHGQALPTPLTVARSADVAGPWVQPPLGPSTDNGITGHPPVAPLPPARPPNPTHTTRP